MGTRVQFLVQKIPRALGQLSLCATTSEPMSTTQKWCWARASLVAQTVKRLSAMRDTWVRSLGREDPLEKEWQSTPALLPGKSHGWRSLVGYSPWGCKESDMTERLHFMKPVCLEPVLCNKRSHCNEKLNVYL